MNMDEAVSRGCAYECAMISPLFVVKAVGVVDYVNYPIRVSWDASAAGGASNDPAPGDAGVRPPVVPLACVCLCVCAGLAIVFLHVRGRGLL